MDCKQQLKSQITWQMLDKWEQPKGLTKKHSHQNSTFDHNTISTIFLWVSIQYLSFLPWSLPENAYSLNLSGHE
jgi:hypothetical protein